jgi:hypothetical protein
MTICAYCGKGKRKPGWHSCKQAKLSKARIDEVIKGIHRQMDKPGSMPMTSLQMKQRADRLRQMATGIKLQGGKVKPDYV